MDDYSGFASMAKPVLAQEPFLISNTDLVLASSHLLYKRIRDESESVILLQNGTDFEHFSSPGPLRPLAGIGHPIIGYYGAISDWFDVDLIRKAAISKPGWHFVLIGEVENEEVWSLKKLPNVHLPGPQPYSSLPSYLQDFDVACIPFLDTPLTRAVNPVKFYEYLSAGKPVVSVRMPDLEQHPDYFYPAGSAAEFVSQIEKALSEDSEEQRRTRIDFASKNRWEDRFAVLKEAIERL